MTNTFGKRLRWLREFRKMTLREFADRAGADPGYLSKLETGKAKNASRRFLARVVVAFRVNSDWLASGNGEPFWNISKDEQTRIALAGWSDKRLQRIIDVIDDLPDALAADRIITYLLRDENLQGLKSIWGEVLRLPNLPFPARVFWSDVFMRCQFPKMQVSSPKQDLTDSETSVKPVDVKAQLPDLLERLKKATQESGQKSALAKFLGAPLASVSRWLSGEREPGGEVTLKLIRWCELQERQAK